MAIKEESVSRLKQKTDLKDLISEYIDLKKSGRSLKGLCPFHDEKTPSFSVEEDHYHCYGCGAHGDIINFLMDYQNLSFVEAVESLAHRYDFNLEYTNTPKKPSLKEPMLEMENFYRGSLMHLKEGREAYAYLLDRGITSEMIQLFGIGFSPEQNVVERYFQETDSLKKYKPIDLGILPVFSGRIVFPIRDSLGRPIAFGCRKWKEGQREAKYVNSNETDSFKKSLCLYGVDISRKRMAKERCAILVEGYTDVIRIVSVGLSMAVASLGTAFNQNHSQALKKIGVDRVLIAFDGDSPGRSAALNAGKVLVNEGLEPLIVQLPDGEDVDSFIRDRGPVEFQKILEEASSFIPFMVKQLYSKQENATYEKERVCKECLTWIDSIKSPVLMCGLRSELAKSLKLSESDVAGVSKHLLDNLSLNVKTALEAEKRALCAILLFSDNSSILEFVHLDYFENPVCRKVFEILQDHFQKGLSQSEAIECISSEGLKFSIPYFLNFANTVSVNDIKKIITSLRRDVLIFRLKKEQRTFKLDMSSGKDVSSTRRRIRRIENELSLLG